MKDKLLEIKDKLLTFPSSTSLKVKLKWRILESSVARSTVKPSNRSFPVNLFCDSTSIVYGGFYI